MIPNHRINAGLAISAFKSRIRFRADARYVGRQVLRGDEENVEMRLPDYGVADISVEVNLGRYELRVMVPNVLDSKYTTFGTFAANPTLPGSPVQRFLTPGQPRHLLASVSANF
jgi:TonB dependent receptor